MDGAEGTGGLAPSVFVEDFEGELGGVLGVVAFELVPSRILTICVNCGDFLDVLDCGEGHDHAEDQDHDQRDHKAYYVVINFHCSIPILALY